MLTLANDRFGTLLVDSAMLALAKFAGGPDMESPKQMEREFAQLALSFIRDRAAALMTYMIGFEVVESEPDGSKGVGVFGFDIEGEMWAVPCFFSQGQLKGMDILYNVKKNQMYPLTEAWIGHILSRRSSMMGEAKQLSPEARGFSTPDLRWAQQQPQQKMACKLAYDAMHRTSQAMLRDDVDTQRAFAGAIAAMTGQTVTDLKFNKLASLINDPSSGHAGRILRAWYQHPRMHKAASYFFDVDDLVQVPVWTTPGQVKLAESLTLIERDYGHSDCFGDNSDDSVAVKRTRLLVDGFVIDDNRKADDVSKEYNPESAKIVFNPSHDQEAQLLLTNNKSVACTVFAEPVLLNDDDDLAKAEATVLVLVESSQGKTAYYVANQRDVFLLHDSADNAQAVTATVPGVILYEGASAIDAIKIRKRYVLVSECGRVSMPFQVSRILENDGKVIGFSGNSEEPRYRGISVTVDDRSGPILVRSKDSYNTAVVVPRQTWKVQEVDGSFNEVFKEIVPASSFDSNAFFKSAGVDAILISHEDGNFDISVNAIAITKKASYRTAVITLCQSLGMPAESAYAAVKEAGTGYKARRWLKRAQNVSFPEPPPEPQGQMPYSGVPINYDYQAELQGNSGYPPPVPPPPPELTGAVQTSGPDQQPPQDVMALSENAAASGQGKILEMGGLGGLARTYDVGSAIDSFLPGMMKAMDSLGRIIYLFYWKNEDFAERYGSEDLAEMEDHLRSTFKQFGDLILALKQKSVEQGSDQFVDPTTKAV